MWIRWRREREDGRDRGDERGEKREEKTERTGDRYIYWEREDIDNDSKNLIEKSFSIENKHGWGDENSKAWKLNALKKKKNFHQ